MTDFFDAADRRGPNRFRQALAASLEKFINDRNPERKRLGFPPFEISSRRNGSPRKRFTRLFSTIGAVAVPQ